MSTYSALNISNINATTTTIFNKTNFSSLYVTGNSTLQNNVTCLSSLNVSGITTLSNNTIINGTLNVSGSITGSITGSGSALTNLNYNNIYNPPSIPNLNNASTFTSSLNVSGTTTLSNPTTCISTLNVSGTTTLNNYTIISGSLNVSGGIYGSGSALTNLNYNAITNPPAIVNLNNPTTFVSSLFVSGNSTFQGASTRLSSLNVSGVTTLANITTCLSSLNVSGNSTFQGASTHISSLNVMGPLYISGTTTVFNSIAGFSQGLQVNGGSQFYNYLTCSSNLNVIGVLTTTNNVCIGTSNPSSILTVNNIVNDRSSYDHSQAPLTLTHQTPTTNTVLNDPQPVLNLCRQGTGGVAYGARATFKICRYEDPGNVWSRTRMDLILADTTYSDVTVMIFKSNGFVGIAINPSFLLHVANITVSASVTNAVIYQSTWLTTQSGTYNRNICAKFENDLWTAGYLNFSSDYRIKTNIQDIDDDNALQLILKIQPKTYNYIDVIERGTDKVYGFIAQQIQEVIPEAVTLNSDFIPNIYNSFECENFTINIPNSNLNIGDEIKILDINGNKKQYIVQEVNLNNIIVDNPIEGDKCFIIGSKVNDFHTLNKDYIFTLNVCATQDLYKLIQNQNEIIEDLKKRIEILENK